MIMSSSINIYVQDGPDYDDTRYCTHLARLEHVLKEALQGSPAYTLCGRKALNGWHEVVMANGLCPDCAQELERLTKKGIIND